MCGIIGYIGTKKAKPILINGLLRLEYRGYDSSGIATVEKDGIKVIKEKGRIANLDAMDGINDLEGTIVLVIPDGQHMENLLLLILIHIMIKINYLLLCIME